jgi:N-acetylglutamate synthase-like GNAT family acetyltransferase
VILTATGATKATMNELSIISLTERPEHAETCAAWSFGEWGCHTPGNRLDKVIERYQKSSGSKELPATWIAVTEDKIAGMVSLKMNDHPDRTDIHPWLASLFVHPFFRRRSIAKHLCCHIEHCARSEYGHDELYLFTPLEDFYVSMGWENIGTVRCTRGLYPQGEILMRKAL